MKKSFAPIILILVCLSLSIVGTTQHVVAYSEIGIGIDPTEITTCPDRVLTSDDIRIEVQNLADKTRTFDVEITDNCKEGNGCNPFNKYQYENLVLMSGERKQLDTIFIHLPYAMEPGAYELKVTVTDVSTLEEESRTIDLNVLECYSVDLIVDEERENICSDDIETTYYDFSVRNNGQDTETFRLSSSETWATFRDAQTKQFLTNIELAPGETSGFELVLNPPKLATGSYEIEVFIESTSSYAEDSGMFVLEVNDCFDFIVNLDPTENTACSGRSAEYTLTIENTGQTEDTFLVNAPSWVEIQDNEVTLAPGETRQVLINANPSQEGRTEFNIMVNSASDSGATKTITAYVTSEACRGATVEIVPSDYSICGGEIVSYTVKVKNLGTESDTFVLETDAGILEHELVTINSMETKIIDLTVDTSGLTGLNVITVTVRGEDVEKIATTDLNIEDCFGAMMQIIPEIETRCACSEVNYSVVVTNTGEGDNFTLDFEGLTESFFLDKNEIKTIVFDYAVACELEGANLLTASLTSEGGISETVQTSLEVTSKDTCYGIEFERTDDGKVIEITDCGQGVVLLLKNTGEATIDYLVSINGPEWLYVEPIELTLENGEDANIYVYIAPLYGTEAGLYTATVTVDSFNVHEEIELNINIESDYLPSEENQSESFLEGESVLEINTSFGDEITGEFVGNQTADEADIPMWKTLTIGIITLIIILVLIARFVLLMRK